MSDMCEHTYAGAYQSAIARAKKILIAAGFPWSVTSGRYSPFFNEQTTSAGVRVTRMGCSETITIHVHDPITPAVREDRRLINALAIATLRDAGMPFDDRGWLACGKDARRAEGKSK